MPRLTISESADAVITGGALWIDSAWQRARRLLRNHAEALLVIDEIQKIPGWSEYVKKCWDEDTRLGNNLKVILSGSSRLLLGRGLSESLMGRFELLRVTHWSFPEMKEAFGCSLEEYLYFGGYPGLASWIGDEHRWKDLMRYSIITPSISNGILYLENIKKPALMKQVFELSCLYSAEILPYSRMLGQLDEAGNTTTIATYLNLLDENGLVAGLQKYSGSAVKQRASSPKLQVYNNALYAAVNNTAFSHARETADLWGRYVESCVGAHLKNLENRGHCKLYYWREGSLEAVALEVKSGRRLLNKGMTEFFKRYPGCSVYTISANAAPGSSVIPLEEFLSVEPWRPPFLSGRGSGCLLTGQI